MSRSSSCTGTWSTGRLWTETAEQLATSHRCLVPDWPLGAHASAMNEDADLTPPGIARIISDFLDALDLRGVTIVANDSGGAMSQVLVTRHPERIGRLVLTNCDTFENFPPLGLQAAPSARQAARGDDRVGLPFGCPPFAAPPSLRSRSGQSRPSLSTAG